MTQDRQNIVIFKYMKLLPIPKKKMNGHAKKNYKWPQNNKHSLPNSPNT